MNDLPEDPMLPNPGSRTFSRAFSFKLHVVGERVLAHYSGNETSCIIAAHHFDVDLSSRLL